MCFMIEQYLWHQTTRELFIITERYCWFLFRRYRRCSSFETRRNTPLILRSKKERPTDWEKKGNERAVLVPRKWELISEEVITCRQTYSNVNLAVVEWNTPWYSFVRATVTATIRERPSLFFATLLSRENRFGCRLLSGWGNFDDVRYPQECAEKRSYLSTASCTIESYYIF